MNNEIGQTAEHIVAAQESAGELPVVEEKKAYTMQDFSEDIDSLVIQMESLIKRPEVSTYIWSEFSTNCALSISKLLKNNVTETVIREEIEAIFSKHNWNEKRHRLCPSVNGLLALANEMLEHKRKKRR